MNTTLRRVFSKRPLDISTLHNLRPKEPAEDPKPAPSDPEPEFKPANEIFPLAKLLLDMAVRADALNAAKLVENTLWDVAEEPDVRRNLIALKPRLIPKDQRPLSTSNTSHEAVSAITSGSLHISTEARASAAAYALERNVSILNILLPLVSMEDPNWHKTIVYWVHSRLFLAGVMTAICDSMRQFSTLGVVRELFAALWHAAKDGELAVDGIAVKRTWSAVNFCPLAMRLSNQVNEEYMTWEMVQEIASRT
ncbi:hypothetical protein FBU59_005080 [Linderina macrospora]|uniref:Uncharacterized protein n=1 Tax=Linderina macrospora TaxID=4868 RepID=A0ACC1J3K5_9FUNG|nr:hypothetical protein FBU59_005080 [Linderina macrospora]